MPYFAERDGTLVTPTEVSKGEQVFCPSCGGMLSIREGHFNQGKRIDRHFSHRRGEGCGGESIVHKRMKTLARYKLEQIFPTARVTEEFQIGPRYADVVARFTWPIKPFGKGLVVEVQHKHKEKNISAVNNEYLKSGYSVYWGYQSDFAWEDKEMEFAENRALTVWPDVLPNRTGTQGYPGCVRKLWAGDYQFERNERVTIPAEYWEMHALEVASPRHGEYQTHWDLLDDFWLNRQDGIDAWLTINRSPGGTVVTELWRKDRRNEEVNFLPIPLQQRGFEDLLVFARDIQTMQDVDRRCAPGPEQRLCEVTIGHAGSTHGRISIVDDTEGTAQLEFARRDTQGNERTVRKPFHPGDPAVVDDLCHRLSQYIQSAPVH